MPELKASGKPVFGGGFDLKKIFRQYRSHPQQVSPELPLKSELFSAEQMERHGKILAGWHKLSEGRAPDRLLARLADNEARISEVCQTLTLAVKDARQVTPAGEWLLDNFYLIEEQISTAKKHLPRTYSKALPRLEKGPSAGRPRVYDIALEAISHGDGRIDSASLRRFVAAYQTVAPLKLGELWAIPIMLRLALIENLRRVAARLEAGFLCSKLAGKWADQMIASAEKDPGSLILLVADMARSAPPMDCAFVAELARRLQGQSPVLNLPLTWIGQKLTDSGLTIERQVQAETQQQAADQVSIANSIGSLRFLDTTDWREFVEALSLVHRTLCADTDAHYSQMDFSTRDQYRHVIEKLAMHSRTSEDDVAAKLVQMAKAGTDERSTHVGFYLIGDGRRQLEQALGMPVSGTLKNFFTDSPLRNFISAVMILTGIFSAAFLTMAQQHDFTGWLLGLVGLLSILATAQLAIALVNWLSTLLTVPRSLPRMDFSQGLPLHSQVVVVVPSMLCSPDHIERLCDDLEVRYLANRDAYYCLLTDFADASSEVMPADAGLVALAQKNVEALNKKYALDADLPLVDADSDSVDLSQPPIRQRIHSPFFLLHRPRRWNAQEQCWMGWERKRGKLSDFNGFLRGRSCERFSHVVGNVGVLQGIRYVITLDTDTQLPRDSVKQLVAAMAHPLNRPRYDESKKRIVDGYGILQPRVATGLSKSGGSWYAQLGGGETGIDPYTRMVSDVYQDLFGEGSFIGKGIYDVDAFEQVTHERFPENQILSHDLLEGCYARSGLMSDVQFMEEYPARFLADVARRHRWIRGDWQLVGWLFAKVASGAGARVKNPLSALSRWKIFDNLRRSLNSSALLLLLLIGWFASPFPVLWMWAVLGIIALPALNVSLIALFNKSREILLRQHFMVAMRASGRNFAHAMLTLTFLPFETYYSLDAIVRTLWRMLVSQKNLLEWNPSSETGSGCILDLPGTFRAMWISPALALTVGTILALLQPEVLAVALPILLLWGGAPLVAWWISTPLVKYSTRLTADQLFFLRRLARKTWAFFDTYVGAEDHWLPPDNVQEQPVPVVAHRTSPTNIGLSLLANLAAYDFGYIPAGRFIVRTENTLRTLALLERYQGHFYNWYDTRSLQPLHPIYVSSVDSGNLAGHLMTLQPGLLTLIEQPIFSVRCWAGFDDTFRLMRDAAHENDTVAQPSRLAVSAALASLEKQLEVVLHSPPVSLGQIHLGLVQLTNGVTKILACVENFPESALHRWTSALLRQCNVELDELIYLAPWIALDEFVQEMKIFGGIDTPPSLHEVMDLAVHVRSVVEQKRLVGASIAELEKFNTLVQMVGEGSRRAAERIETIGRLACAAVEFARMEYGFLYDKTTHFLSIGYNVHERRLDESHYDLLASEARLSSFVGIAQGKIPQDSWFALGRQLTIAGNQPILLSWSGSMFEYLMPMLVMPSFDNTLLDQTCRAAVQRQIDYGAQRAVPWGFSESGYYAFDAHLNYQYRAFGVPGLGFKRGLGDDLVVAPYASLLALMVMPEQACRNLQRLAKDGYEGDFGFYEAIDYTASRLPRGQTCAVVRSFMSHHQGMGLLSLAHLLLDRPMQKRFASDPLFQATMLLLQERIPKTSVFYANTSAMADIRTGAAALEMPMRILNRPDTRIPEVQLLSNGRYHVMVTNAGGSCSNWKDLAVTRWREDGTRDHWGTFCYVRDVESGKFWSTAHQPTMVEPENYEVIFSAGRAEFRRRDNGFDMHTEIVVSPEDDIELRRTRITNRSGIRRTIDVTSYAEVVLAPAASDAAHPAFGKLFVQTEIVPQNHAIVCTRRPRSVDEKPPWMFHLMAVHGIDSAEVSYETDRLKFIGRGNTPKHPDAMTDASVLSGTAGSVLDPVVAIRYKFTLEPEQVVTVDIVNGIAETRETIAGLMGKYQDVHMAHRVFELAWTHSHVVLRQLNASESDAQLYERLASSVLYSNLQLRADSSILSKNRRGQSGLWSYAISGDLPIVLLQIGDVKNIQLVRQLVQAHAYWRQKGLAVDLVIWNEDHAGYRQLLQEQIMGLVGSGVEGAALERPGGIFVRLAEQISNEDRILLQSVARVVIRDSDGTLAEQVNRRTLQEARMSRLKPTRDQIAAPQLGQKPRSDLILCNGIGGFTPDGREYVITIAGKQATPAPWVNVLANPHFGSVISESGQMYTWGENAHEFRLTPWNNDPVSDGGGEAFYLRDEDSGAFWSPMALPCRGSGSYVCRHGFGYSIFEHVENGIHSTLTVTIALDASIKYSILKVRNDTGADRRLSITGYVEWVLGELREKSAMHIVTEVDPASGALFARNAYNTGFPERIAFFNVDATAVSVSGDRTEFIGRNGSLQNPQAMYRTRLSGRLGAGLDPCGAIQVPFDLADGEEREFVFMLGLAGRRSADVSSLVHRHSSARVAHDALDAVQAYWRRTLSAIQIDTPDAALNVFANGWLMYQTIACRLWARSGYYQSGGAYGFRDQLQDVMALIHAEPGLVRAHLLLCAAHQFVEGDVQHWWHPPSDRGVRTHCSDDYLWLPLATYRYVTGTGDTGVLNEQLGFLEGRAVNQDEDSYYDLPGRAAESASLYEHCVRAIVRGLRFGEHGLPLIGSCDWNDGMDKVGAEGKGESVWLAFFLCDVLKCFAEVATLQGDMPFAKRCRSEAATLSQNIENNAWDGEWYRRAYFDDGSPLGSATNPECQIDSISQSWAVLSEAADPQRARMAMQNVDQRLVRREHALIQLLDPPFNTSHLNPGYIKGYVPGVRENGGQYTHAAIWTAMAFAKLGDRQLAWEMLDMINPLNHGRTPEQVAVYKVEPYVLAADVYAVSPHIGRGGWTWYTGSSGWMYRLIIESLLGLQREADSLRFVPCVPKNWHSFKLTYRYRETLYNITLTQLAADDPELGMIVDGVAQSSQVFSLVDDRVDHTVDIRFCVIDTERASA